MHAYLQKRNISTDNLSYKLVHVCY